MSDNEKPRLYAVPDLPADDTDPAEPNKDGKITGIPTPETLDPKGQLVLQPEKQSGIPNFETETPADFDPQFEDPDQPYTGSPEEEQASVRNHPSNPKPTSTQ